MRFFVTGAAGFVRSAVVHERSGGAGGEALNVVKVRHFGRGPDAVRRSAAHGHW